MAVQFASAAATYVTNLGLGSAIAHLTTSAWVKISVDRNVASTVWALDDGTAANQKYVQTTADGVTITFNGATAPGPALTVNTWYHIIWSNFPRPNLQSYLKVRAEGVPSFTTTVGPGFTLPGDFFRIGNSATSTQWLSGCVSNVKVWNASLTEIEMEAEYQYKQPLRRSNLVAYYAFDAPSTVDNSGLGHTLTGGTGATTTTGPTGLIDVPAPTPFQGWGLPIF